MSNARTAVTADHDRWKMLEHLFDAIAILDRNKQVKFANVRFRKLAHLSEPRPLAPTNISDCLDLPVNCWDSLKESYRHEVPRVNSVPFTFRGGAKGFAQVYVESLPIGDSCEPDLFICVLHDITFEIQSRTQLDENERLISELRRRHAEAQFLWRLSTETPIYLDPAALLVTIAKKLKEELGFEDACFLQIPDTDEAFPEPIHSEHRIGSRLRVVAQSLVPVIRKKTGRSDVFSQEFESFGTFWVTSFRPKLEKPFFLLARSEQSARDSNRKPLLEPLATQITGWLDNRSVYLSSITDSLTGLYNRRHFDSRFTVECLLARERQVILSLILVDIDHFKKINDSHGHQIGDQVLKAAASSMKSVLRSSDITARVGGEEFAALLFDASPEDAVIAAEKIRKRIEETPIPVAGLGHDIRITVSIGIAGYMGLQHDTPEAVYGAADQALYRAKNSGRNRIELSQDDPASNTGS